jgi:hypothetical protein
MANITRRRNPLLPWWIGFGIILAAVIYVSYQFLCQDCQAPAVAQILVFGVVPVVYLVLMNMTFRSQAEAEDEDQRGHGYDPRSGRGSSPGGED